MATVSMHGDSAKLAELIKSVRETSTPAWRARLNKNLSQEARTQMVNGFLEQRDPYGTPWKQTFRGGQILRKTTLLMNSVQARADETSFELHTATKYARAHQFGAVITPKKGKYLKFQVPISTRVFALVGPRRRLVTPKTRMGWVQVKQVTIPRRQFMPDQGRVGPIWMAAFQRVVESQLRGAVQK